MQYLITFLEGVITFISPCLLPMLPVYVSYFAPGESGGTARAARNALGFVLGFTLVFTAMGALAGTVGAFLRGHQTLVNIVSGAVVIIFGLSCLGVFSLGFLRGGRAGANPRTPGFFSALLFGMIFSVGWTPCVGAFLGSALMLAAQRSHMLEGMALLLVYSAGLGIPFVLSAVLIDRLKGAFGWIKSHYKVINAVCGALLILVGILMATGQMGRWLAALS